MDGGGFQSVTQTGLARQPTGAPDRLCPPERGIADLSGVAKAGTAVVWDQFGVLHDGHRAFSGARARCARLAEAGVPMAVVSNSGKRSAANAERLDRLGFPSDWFVAVLTSGELAHLRLAKDLREGRLVPGSRIMVLSRGGDLSVVRGLDLEPVPPGEAAELVLIAGIDAERSLAFYHDALAGAVATGVPCLCCNPDTVTFRPDGHTTFGPGRLARDYVAAGGAVESIGKPGPAIFEAAIERLGVPASRCLMVGDSVAHDGVGATASGMRFCLVTSGVFAGEPAARPDLPVPDHWMTAVA